MLKVEPESILNIYGVVPPLLVMVIDPVDWPKHNTLIFEMDTLLTWVAVNNAVLELAVPDPLNHLARYCVPLSITEAINTSVSWFSPKISVQVVPLILFCH